VVVLELLLVKPKLFSLGDETGVSLVLLISGNLLCGGHVVGRSAVLWVDDR